MSFIKKVIHIYIYIYLITCIFLIRLIKKFLYINIYIYIYIYVACMYVRMLGGDGPLRITTYHVTGYHQEIAFTTTFTTTCIYSQMCFLCSYANKSGIAYYN